MPFVAIVVRAAGISPHNCQPKLQPGQHPGEVDIPVAILHAKQLAATGKYAAARDTRQKAEMLSPSEGMLSVDMLARLALGTVEPQFGQVQRGEQLLEAFAQDSQQKGFAIVYQQAKSDLSAAPSLTAGTTGNSLHLTGSQ